MKNKSAAAVCLACVVGGAALFFIAVRPCEPVAQAAESPVVQMPEQTIILEPSTVTIIEPGHFTPAKHMAGVSQVHSRCVREYVLGGSYTTCR